MSYCQHVVYKREAAFGTWVTPDTVLSSEVWGVKSRREQVKLRTTGACRGLYQAVPGAKVVNGPWRFPWWPVNTLQALAAWFRDTAVTGVDTGVYDHGILANDAAGLLGLSMQGQYSTTRALNALSCVATKLTLTAAAKQPAYWSIDLLAKDEVRNDGTWDNDGTGAPAIIAVSASDYDTTRPLMFYDATLVLGGTPSFTDPTNLWSIAAGTTYSGFDMVEIAFDLGVDADAFSLQSDPTIYEAWPGPRSITVRLESSWTDLSTTFYDAFDAGTEMALQLKLAGPVISGAYTYEGEITLPAIHFDPDNIFPDVGPQDRLKSMISGEAVRDDTSGLDHGIRIRTSEATA